MQACRLQLPLRLRRACKLKLAGSMWLAKDRATPQLTRGDDQVSGVAAAADVEEAHQQLDPRVADRRGGGEREDREQRRDAEIDRARQDAVQGDVAFCLCSFALGAVR